MHAAQKTGDIITATADPKFWILLLALPQTLCDSRIVSSNQDSSHLAVS